MGANTGAIKAGKAYVELFTDQTALERGLRGASAKMRAWGLGLAAIGAAITGPLLALGGIFAEQGRELLVVSERLGISVEALTALQYAARRTGASTEDLEAGLFRMNRFLGAAGESGGKTEQVLAQLGLTIGQLATAGTLERFETLAQGLSTITDKARRTRLATEIFGRGVMALLPLLDQGAAGIREFVRQAQAKHLVISTKDAQQAKEFGLEMGAIGNAVKTAGMLLGAGLLPGLREAFGMDKDIAATIVQAASATANWLRANAGLVASVFRLGLYATIAGGALLTIGTILPRIAAATRLIRLLWIGWRTIVITTQAAIGACVLVTGTLTASMAALDAVIAANPVTAVFVALAVGAALGIALLVGVLYALGELDGASKSFGATWDTLTGDMTQAWGGVVAALEAGDLGLAWAVIVAGMQLEWTRFTTWLGQIWDETGLGIVVLALETARGVIQAWADVKLVLATTWADVLFGLGEAWIGFVKLLKTTLSNGLGFIDREWSALQERMKGPLGDVDRARREADDRTAARNQAIDSASSEALAANAKDHDARTMLAGQQHGVDSATPEINALIAAAGQASIEAMDRGAEAVRRAQTDFNNALEAAEIARASAAGETHEIPDPGNTADAVAAGLVHGTFNAAALEGLNVTGKSDALQWQEQAAREAAAARVLLAKLLNVIENGGLIIG